MLANLYLRRLVKTYSEAILNDHKIAEMAEKAAKLPLEDIGIKQELLNKAAARVEQALKESSIDPNRMTNEELMLFLLDMFKNLGGVPSTISDELLEKSAIALAKELKKIEYNRSGYRHGYGKSNRPFSSIKSFSKLTTAIAMIPAFLITLLGSKLNAADVISSMANNPTAVEMAIEKTVLENISPKDSVIRYRKYVKPEKSLIETIRPALEEIKKAGGTSLYEKYNRFTDAGALMPLPERDTLNPDTRIAFRLYKSAKIIYNKFRNKGAVSFDTLLSDEKTEIATQHIMFAAILYNILCQLDYEAHGLNPEQIEQLKQELRAGKYEVKFKDAGRQIVINTLNDTIDLEFIFIPYEMEVIGLDQTQKILIQSQYYNIAIRNLATYKSAIVPVEGNIPYDIYVILPVVVTEGTMSPIHEVAFKIRCSLEVYSYIKDSSGLSLVRDTVGASRLRNKKTRLFTRKKKYDWM